MLPARNGLLDTNSEYTYDLIPPPLHYHPSFAKAMKVGKTSGISTNVLGFASQEWFGSCLKYFKSVQNLAYPGTISERGNKSGITIVNPIPETPLLRYFDKCTEFCHNLAPCQKNVTRVVLQLSVGMRSQNLGGGGIPPFQNILEGIKVHRGDLDNRKSQLFPSRCGKFWHLISKLVGLLRKVVSVHNLGKNSEKNTDCWC